MFNQLRYEYFCQIIDNLNYHIKVSHNHIEYLQNEINKERELIIEYNTEKALEENLFNKVND